MTIDAVDAVIKRNIRPDVLAGASYAVPDASGMLKLEAMENPYRLPAELQAALGAHLAAQALNRYPVPSYTHLKRQLCRNFGVPAGYDVVLGNGSDELISMLSIACANPGAASPAKVLAPLPTFVMYAISARHVGLEFIGVDLNPDLTLNLPAMLAAIEQHQPALVYLPYPNNPTGNLFENDAIEQILHAAKGLVVLDEAYQPFNDASFMPRLPEFANLIVMRTVSKLGLAGIRLGYMSAHPALLAQVEKVRPPYNINVLTQAAAEFLLDHPQVFLDQAQALRQARSDLTAALQQLGVQVFPSAANFVLIRLENADQVFAKLLERKILVKNVSKMHALLHNCLRITVSTPDENQQFLQALSHLLA
ncbi:MAG: hypothetical protein RL748_2576 [Pseudomonadota bacterium]|jgi:histidinol-phosphate aminotransferase